MGTKATPQEFVDKVHADYEKFHETKPWCQRSPPAAALGRRKVRRDLPGEPRRIAFLYLLPAFLVYAAFVLWPLGRAVWLSFHEWDGLTLAQGMARQLPRAREELTTARRLRARAITDPVLRRHPRGARARARRRAFTGAHPRPDGFPYRPVPAAGDSRGRSGGDLADDRRAVERLSERIPGHRGSRLLEGPWLGDFTFALPAVGVVGTWVRPGLARILFMAGVQRIPQSLYDAARVDGAGPVREFFAVTLPNLRGEIAVALTLTTIAALRTSTSSTSPPRAAPATRPRCPRSRSTTALSDGPDRLGDRPV